MSPPITPRPLYFDLRPNDYFTISSYHQPSASLFSSESSFSPSHQPRRLLSPGSPLLFLSLSYPFILCAVLDRHANPLVTCTVDVRDCTLTRLSDEFISSMRASASILPSPSPPIPDMPGCPIDPSPPTL